MRRRILAALVLSLSLLAAPGSDLAVAGEPGQRGTTEERPKRSEKRFWIMTTGQESFEGGVLSAVGPRSEDISTVKSVLSALLRRAEAGKNVSLPGTPGGAARDVGALRTVLEGLSPDGPQRSAVGRSDEPAVGATTSETARQARLDYPDSFPVKGQAINDGYVWLFYTELGVQRCSSAGCTETDRVEVRWFMNPGYKADRFDFNARYFPNSGNLRNIYADAGVYCNYNSCGEEEIPKSGARNGQGSGQDVVQHRSNAGGKQADLIRLNGTCDVCVNRDQADRARTATANCRREGAENPNCVW